MLGKCAHQMICIEAFIFSIWKCCRKQRFLWSSGTRSLKLLLPDYKMAEKPKIIFVLGGPGAGKGTQCSKIVKTFNFEHISAGDLLRAERARAGSEYGQLIEDCMKKGCIVPVEVTCALIETAMSKSSNDKFLIDGFPRNQDNLDGWNRQMAHKVDFQFVLFFNCPDEVCINRCMSRGMSGSGRPDDNIDTLRMRLQNYRTDSIPIIDYFKGLDKVIEIKADISAEDIFDYVKGVFHKYGFQ